MDFTLNELALAFRKAKVDMYYSSHASLLDWAGYEARLTENLHQLLDKLNGVEESWVEDKTFIGDWKLVPKAIKPPENYSDKGFVCGAPKERWEQLVRFGTEDNRPEAQFRLMAACSVDFHVVSALWILKVGHKFDNTLSKNAYGNRLRRNKNGEFNKLSLGSFKPYLKPYQNWRDNGIAKIKEAIGSEKKILALTTDISGFYHALNASFVRSESFISRFRGELSLTNDEEKLNRLFVNSLEAWALGTPTKNGLPVGLPASAIIANLALSELDFGIEKDVVPLYYGRYVDDILLVMENGPDISSLDELWKWLLKRLQKHGLVKTHNDVFGDAEVPRTNEGITQISFQPEYLMDCDISFSEEKTKVFLLAGETGEGFIASIQRHIQQRGSEWRALPNLPESSEGVSTSIVAATEVSGEKSDSISKVDLVSLRRSGFAMQLRDFEAYERDLAPNDWLEHRHAFFQSVIDHLLVLPKMFELETYLPRIVQLATSCEDFAFLRKILDRLTALTASIENNCEVSVKSIPEKFLPNRKELVRKWHDHIFSSVFQGIATSFPFNLSPVGRLNWEKEISPIWGTFFFNPSLKYFNLESISDGPDELIDALQETHLQLFLFDLAHMPFRFLHLPDELVSRRGIPQSAKSAYEGASLVIPDQIENGVNILRAWIERNRWIKTTEIKILNGLVYATRPFSISELYFVSREMLESDESNEAKAVVLAVRGFTFGKKRPQYEKNGKIYGGKLLNVPNPKNEEKKSVAVSSWKNERKHWAASVKKDVIPNFDRYQRLVRLVNSVISNKTKISYFVLPELAIPANWFLRIATKLQRSGISLISGVEYLHADRDNLKNVKKLGNVRNQVWAALTHDGLGFNSMMVYRQDKQTPAFHEETRLFQFGGVRLEPEKTWSSPPIINHGGFRFSLLVCSELTNIGYRADLRGKIDALFVPEWNQDIESFNPLVESAALDIHAYIIQCNSRDFGDSRIRAPDKKAYKRDVLRVKGGTDDFFVCGEIDVQELRKFQSHFRSPSDGPFKPVPDGFEIDEGRKVPL